MIKKLLRFCTDRYYRFDVLQSKGFLNRMDDRKYLEMLYRVLLGKDLDLENPSSFNEKLQWLKLHDRKPIYTQMVDKYEAKKFVSGIIGEEYIIPTIGIWDRYSEINFSSLPKQFVLKCTHDSGGIVVVRDKELFDFKTAKKKINKSLKKNFYYFGREWPYKNVKPRIICEKYMEDSNPQGNDEFIGLVDYKFFCFDGEAKLLYVSKGLEDHSTAGISFYDLDGKELPFHRNDYRPYHHAIMPSNLKDMIIIANRLAKEVPSPFVRIDLYSINNKIYFSEITLSPCSGMIPFEPMTADDELGQMIHLPIKETP